MAIYAEKGGPDIILKRVDKETLVGQAVARIGKVRKALILPPDFTRYHSNAGELTAIFYGLLTKQGTAVDILPALGTHFKMTETEIRKMFGPDIPLDRFKVHDWRSGITKIGEVPSAFIKKVSGGKLDYAVSVEVDKLLVDPSYEVIISIGQVVPHEVAGMANHNKNIFVGAGGSDIINKTHFLGSVYNMERIMGRAASPVRDVLNYAEDNFLAGRRIVYVQTVMSRQADGSMAMNGLFIGDGREGYVRAAALSQRMNIILLDAPIKKAVVFLDPAEFKSTWLGNKAVYRTRMAMADNGELLVIAPGLHQFGEDPEIDRLIRKYGYRGTTAILKAVKDNADLQGNRSAAAHLIHGSSEGRFKITYAPGKMTEKEITGVNFNYRPLDETLKQYDPAKLKDGYTTVNGEEIFYISNPAVGLWGLKNNF